MSCVPFFFYLCHLIFLQTIIMMYYMYIFALRLSEGNAINTLYICKFWKDYHLLNLLITVSTDLVGDHYSK